MSSRPRVELVDPSREGESLARALRAAEIEVEHVDASDLRAREPAPVVLVAAELREAPGLLAHLAAHPTTVALMLGLPEPGSTADFPELREDRVFPRPLATARIVRRVRTLLAPAERTLTVPSDGSEPPPAPVEHTMQLASPTLAGALSPSAPGELLPTTPGALEGPAVELSAQLADMLQQADRRLFPDLPPLDLRVSAGDETARELVPDELLAAVAQPVDKLEAEEQADAFTFFGPPPDAALTRAPGATPSSTTSGRRGAGGDAGRDPAGTVPELARAQASEVLSGSVTVDFFDLGEPVVDGDGRQGELAGAAAIGIVFRLWERRLTVDITFTPDGGPTVLLRLLDGRPAAFVGPVYATVAREVGLSPAGGFDSEDAARAALERALGQGGLGSYELDRRACDTRLALLMKAVTAPAGRFRIDPHADGEELPDPDRAALFRGSLPSLLLSAARRHLSTRDLEQLTGDGSARVELLTGAHRIFRAAEVEPELIRTLERNDGVDPRELGASLPRELGATGLFIGLAQMGALRISRQQGRPTRDTPLSTGAIFRALERAMDGDYFHILGVDFDADTAEVEAAHARRLAELRLPQALLDQEPRVASALEQALEAIDEAHRVLRVDVLRRRYRDALSPATRRLARS